MNLDRWNKIIQSACKQAQVLYFPILEEAMKFDKFILSYSKTSYIASIGASAKLTEMKKSDKDLIIIGPEGDFSEREFNLIRKQGVKEVTLSGNILRVETAGIVAISQWNS